MKKNVILILFMIKILTVCAQNCIAERYEISISHYLSDNCNLKRFGQDKEIFYNSKSKIIIYTNTITDTIETIYEIKISFTTIDSQCCVTILEILDLFVSDTSLSINNKYNYPLIRTAIEDRICDKYFFYEGSFNNDIIFYALPIKFIPYLKSD